MKISKWLQAIVSGLTLSALLFTATAQAAIQWPNSKKIVYNLNSQVQSLSISRYKNLKFTRYATTDNIAWTLYGAKNKNYVATKDMIWTVNGQQDEDGLITTLHMRSTPTQASSAKQLTYRTDWTMAGTCSLNLMLGALGVNMVKAKSILGDDLGMPIDRTFNATGAAQTRLELIDKKSSASLVLNGKNVEIQASITQKGVFDLNVSVDWKGNNAQPNETIALVAGKTTHVKVGQPFTVSLSSSSGTGYTWSYVMAGTASNCTALGKESTAASMPGGPLIERWTFKANQTGAVTLTFTNARSWEKTANDTQMIYQVQVDP